MMHYLLLLLLLLLLHQLFLIASSTTLYLNCGSSNSITAVSGDSRNFTSDSPFLSPDNSPTLTNNSINITADYSSLYNTARLFTSHATYNFPVSSSGTHVLRLHFFPFNSLSTAKFDVYALRQFQLLTNFSATSLVIKEYFMWADEGQDFVLEFIPSSKLGFVSAIELFTAPPEVIPNTDNVYENLAHQAMETMHRLNVGGPKVAPFSDTLWRTWLTDDQYVIQPWSSVESHVDASSVKYQVGVTRDVAPVSVYSTARTMNVSDNMRITDFNFNVSWSLPVVSGFHYLVRLHFCDIVSPAQENTIYFNVYVGTALAFPDLNSRVHTDDVREAFYTEWAARDTGKYINVSIGRSTKSPANTANAYLNGLEVFKLNNTFASLDGSTNSLYQLSHRKHSVNLVVILVPCVVGGLVLIGVTIMLLLIVRKRFGERTPAVEPKDKPNSCSPKTTSDSSNQTSKSLAFPKFNFDLQLPLSSIIAATKGFDDQLVIGRGGFGKVYKGLLENNTVVAVKRGSDSSRQGDQEFKMEITLLSHIRHKHLLSLVGYCNEQSERILVYEYMEKGPLKDHLYGSPDKPCLSWKQRLEICIGAARGIYYLHTGLDSPIIHRDVKSTNILLDKDYFAKVSDFGLSKIGPTCGETHVSTIAKGTVGYWDPEYFRTGQLTDKSDVYSFGVVLFEVLCARPVIEIGAMEQLNLAEWAVHWHSRKLIEKIIDPRLTGKINNDSLRTFAEIAVKCLAEHGIDRPNFGEILWCLEYALSLQENEVRREPYEDSVVTGTVAVPIMNMPLISRDAINSTNSTSSNDIGNSNSISSGATDNNMVTRMGAAQAGLSESSVFSQLKPGDGR